ncbi:UNVERIFIED_CONTAM: VPS10 domain-containing receptor SorCS2, partial [Gekko kuhli]
FRYVVCPCHNCSDERLRAPFLGRIDHNSLTVQDDYIFLQASSANQTKYYVSYRRNEFVQMKLPKYALPKDLQIISTDESQVFVAVQEWYQTDTYNLYQSDTQGVSYSIVLENVRSTKQPEENVLIDILEVRGVKGVFLANQKIDGKVTTLITFNKGRDWDFLIPPAADMNGVIQGLVQVINMLSHPGTHASDQWLSSLQGCQPSSCNDSSSQAEIDWCWAPLYGAAPVPPSKPASSSLPRALATWVFAIESGE